MVEAGLATQHWSGKLKAVLSTASINMLLLGGFRGMSPKRIFKIACSEIESESISNILLDLYIGVILTLAVYTY